MEKWWVKFWWQHGERIFFMVAALLLCAAIWQIESMQAEAKAVVMMVLGIIVKEIRSPRPSNPYRGGSDEPGD